MPNYHAIILDRANYPDTLELAAPNGEKVALGALRQAFIEREEWLNNQVRVMGQARDEVATTFQKLMSEKDQLAQERAQVEAMRAAAGAQNWDENRADPYAAKLEEIDRLVREGQAKLTALEKNQHDTIAQYVSDLFDRDLRGVELPKGVSVKDVIEFAQKNNIKGGMIPDLRKAVEKMREPELIEKRVKDAEAKGYERAMQEAAIASIGGSSRGLGRDASAPPPEKYATLDEAFEKNFAKAAADPEIRGMIAGIMPAGR